MCRGGGKGILCSEEKTFTLSTVDNMRVCKMEIGEDKYGNAKERNTNKILRDLREKIGEKAFEEWGFAVVDTFQQEEILRQDLLLQQRHNSQGQPTVDDSTLSCTEDSRSREMRGLRISECLRCASQKWKLEGQLSREFDAYLSELSQQDSSTKRCMQDLWETSEGLGILREALSTVQEIWRSFDVKSKPIQPCEKARTIVRRLTPIEAERLQGFPDNYTNIPWSNKPIAPDSRRYKALGNSMAVPVMKFIGNRIESAQPVVYNPEAIQRILTVTPLSKIEKDNGQQTLF